MLGGFAGGFGSSMILQMVIKARDEATQEIKKINKEMQGLEKSAGGAGGGLRALISPPVLFGLGALASGLAMSVRAAAESEEAIRGLEAVLKSTGGVAGITKDAALELASSLQQVTRFSDETVINAEKVMLTFTNIGKNVFPDAIKAALDMSTVLGTDLQSSVIQIGKALQDPILGVTALRRVGVSFNEAQIKIIKGLVESNKLFEAQTFILKELQTEFGGAAEAAGETFAGQLDRLQNQVDELSESIGRHLIPALSNIVGGALNIGKLSNEVNRLNESAKKLGIEALPTFFAFEDVVILSQRVAEAQRGIERGLEATSLRYQAQALALGFVIEKHQEIDQAMIDTKALLEEGFPLTPIQNMQREWGKVRDSIFETLKIYIDMKTVMALGTDSLVAKAILFSRGLGEAENAQDNLNEAVDKWILLSGDPGLKNAPQIIRDWQEAARLLGGDMWNIAQALAAALQNAIHLDGKIISIHTQFTSEGMPPPGFVEGVNVPGVLTTTLPAGPGFLTAEQVAAQTRIVSTAPSTIRRAIQAAEGFKGWVGLGGPKWILVGENGPEFVDIRPLKKLGLLIADGGGGTLPPPPTRTEMDVLSLKEAQNLGLISPTTTGMGGGGGGGGGAAILPAPILQAAQQLQEATRSITATIPQVAEMAQPRLTAVNISFQTLIGGPTEDQLTQLARLIVSKINEQNSRVIGLPGR